MYKVKTVLAMTILIAITSCSKELINNNPLGNSPIEIVNSNLRTSSHCDYSPCLGEGDIATANVPLVISDYISDNYKSKIDEAEVLGCNIVEVENENEQDGNFNNDHSDMFTGSVEDIDFYVIELKDGTELLFGHDGNFIAEQKDKDHNNDKDNENEDQDGDSLNLDDVSEKIRAYVATNHVDESILKASSETEFGFEFTEIETENREIIFDSNGEFVCEEKD